MSTLVILDDRRVGKLLDIGFLKSYENQKEYVAASYNYDYHSPEDDFIQFNKQAYPKQPEHFEEYGALKEYAEYFTQNYLYTGN